MKTIRVYVVDNRQHTPPDDTLDGLILSRLALYYHVVIDPKTPQSGGFGRENRFLQFCSVESLSEPRGVFQ